MTNGQDYLDSYSSNDVYGKNVMVRESYDCDELPCDDAISCGIPEQQVHIDYIPGISPFSCSLSFIRNLMEADRKTLLSSKRKLRMILDLDETLVHSIISDQPPSLDVQNHPCFKFSFHLGPPIKYYHVLARPGLKEFIEEAQKYFDLFVYTNGTRPYAEKILETFFGPINATFSGLFVRPDDTCRDLTKKLDRGFLNKQTAIIVDDRTDVWCAEDQPNIVKVEAFRGDVNDTHLGMLMDKLADIHSAYFGRYSPCSDAEVDVRRIMSGMPEDDDLLVDDMMDSEGSGISNFDMICAIGNSSLSIAEVC